MGGVAGDGDVGGVELGEEVAIVIALGIRAYYLQPFRIPTGSMQPTLNGIRGDHMEKKDFPGLPGKALDFVLKGRNYIHKEFDRDRRFRTGDLNKDIVTVQKWNFFTYTYLYFEDGHVAIHAPKDVVLNNPGNGGMGLKSKIRRGAGGRPYVPQGTVVSGFADSGDLVLVDKVSYNFRRPKRGEVFVFDTRGIEGIHKRSNTAQGAGSHYIKRLSGVPGDTLQIKPPTLFVNGEPAKEKYLDQVMNSTGRYEGQPGYGLADPREFHSHLDQALSSPSDSVTLDSREALKAAGKGSIDSYLYREYFALGDNTDNSLDSRYWDSVKEFNLVGPALFSLWPIKTGHWGLIK